ncbi:MAG: 16S rRNA (cytosine(967)-C(5))-methyltransferase RsmB [Firmicutes bacterium]|nr:16S rRNA (cytosine(967)-C(5))-methyltransferase RsmB [Bacillota bacterium]
MDNDRRLAFLVLRDIEKNGSYSNLAMNRVLKAEEASRPAFVRELVYGVLREQMLLDARISRFLKRPGLGLAERLILRMAFYEIGFMGSAAEHAAVSEAVELAKSFAPGKAGFVNAVLRNYLRGSRAPEGDVPASVRWSFAPEIAELWTRERGEEEAARLMEASCSPAPLVIRPNLLKTDRDGLAERLSDRFEISACGLSRHALNVRGRGLLDTEEYREGLFSVQGEASQYAVETLAPAPGSRLIDLCAAPGGKSAAAAGLMKGQGSILAFDLYESRVKLIRAQMKRLGADIVSASAADSSAFRPELSESADFVICDVPCSGLGVLRQKPEIKLRAPEDIDALAELQLRILRNGAAYLRRGGRLLYSTCTVSRRENEVVTERFLTGAEAAQRSARAGVEGPARFRKTFERQLLPEAGGPDGFYICILEKE